VDYVPEWYRGHSSLYELLAVTADWELHRREMYDRIVDVPRLLAGVPGTQGGAADILAEMGAALSIRYRRTLKSVTLAHYRDGRDSVALHGDKMGALRADTVVAIVSVGDRRNFLLRPARAQPFSLQRRLSYRFGGGDLLVMGGTCQQTWEHGVPKMAHAGPRIAIMFRETIPEPRQLGPRQVG
jgi:alkylated DNA repair dioxygenase AlkB